MIDDESQSVEPDFSSVDFGLPHTKCWPKPQLIQKVYLVLEIQRVLW
jgi:hypothetical protein